MKTIIHIIRPLVLTRLVLIGFVTSTLANDVSIPDPGLNAAIRAALQKPAGPLTEQDLLGLTVLHARSGNISNLQGLQAAQNLALLDLASNQFSNLTLPAGLRLSFLDLSANHRPASPCLRT